MFVAMVAQQKHEWPINTCLNNAAVWRAVHIDPGLASGILVAKLSGCSPAKGMAEHADARHVKLFGELAGCVRGIQLLQPVKDESDVGSPRSQQPVRANFPLLARFFKTEFRVVFRNSSHYAAVRKNNRKGAVRRVKANDDIPMTGQILRECRIIPHFGGSPCP